MKRHIFEALGIIKSLLFMMRILRVRKYTWMYMYTYTISFVDILCDEIKLITQFNAFVYICL